MEKKNEIYASVNRIETIDAIRGLSLFGILVVNILSFHAPYFFYGGDGARNTIDEVILTGIDIFVQASFYPLFSLLFGIGIYIMYERLMSQHMNPKKILIRRLIVLSAIGIVHGIVLWYGDILLTYGLIGLVSLMFLKKNSQLLLKWALSLLILPTILFTILLYFQSQEYVIDVVDHAAINESIQHFKGSYVNILEQNLTNWKIAYHPAQMIFMLFAILPMFLIGMIMKKKGWINQPDYYKEVLKKWLIVSLIIFILFKMVPYFFGMPLWFEFAQDVIGGSASAVFYFLLCTLLLRGRNLQKVRRILSNIGKLSLSNYVMQSVICFFLFYGVGLNLYNQLNVVTLMFIAVAIYTVQLIISKWYVKHYYFGPLEWIYRTLTYGKRQPMKKEA
ncbi:DUF418 domain-containing protein [Bacillaceae bacterium W0354]